MKTTLCAFVVAALIAADLAAVRAEAPAAVDWISQDIPAALAEARKQNRPVLLYFAGSNCAFCRRLDAEVWTDARVVEATRRFACLRVISDRQPTLASVFDVRGVPRVLCFNQAGQPIGDMLGYRPADEFLAALKVIAADADTQRTPGEREVTLDKVNELLAEPDDAPDLSAVARLSDAQLAEQVRHAVAALARPDPRGRVQAMRLIAAAGRRAEPALLTLLADDYLAHRVVAQIALAGTCSEAAEFDPWADPELRQRQLAALRQRIATRRPASQPDATPTPSNETADQTPASQPEAEEAP